MKNILVAINFDNLGQEVIRKASQIAEKFDSKLWLIHVASEFATMTGNKAASQPIRDSRAKILREEHQQIQTYAKAIQDKGINAEALLIKGDAVDEIVAKAKSIQADMLVLGAEEYGKIFQLLFKNVWEDVIKASKIPVLIVPHKGY